jgi:hypothetical protein
MTTESSLRSLLHKATHRLPGIPAHVDAPAGHQRTAVHGRGGRRGTPHLSLNRRWNHSSAHPPRFMPAWQHRIAAFFERELR